MVRDLKRAKIKVRLYHGAVVHDVEPTMNSVSENVKKRQRAAGRNAAAAAGREKKRKGGWTQAEMSLLRDSLKNLGRDYTAIQKLLPDRTIAAVRVRGCIIMKEEKLEVKKKAKVGLHVCGINGCTYTTKHTTHLKSHKIACMKRAIILQQGGNKKQRKGPTPTGKVWDKQKGIWL